MAARRNANRNVRRPRKKPPKGPILPVVKGIRKEVVRKIARLEKGVGHMTKKELQTGLRELSVDVKVMGVWIHIICG